MNIPTSRLFILGAGFSRPAGYPLGPELLDQVRQLVKQHFQSAGGWDGAFEEEIEEWQELYPGRELTLESVLAYSHRKHFLRLIGSDEYFSHGSRTIVAVRHYVQFVLNSLLSEDIPPFYLDFARRLTPYDTVLTFNYDTLLERTLDEIGKPYTLTPEWWLDDASQPPSEARYVNVIKLHGSIDWYDREPYVDERRYFDAQGHNVPDRNPLFGPAPSVHAESLARGAVRSNFGKRLLNRVFRVPDHHRHFPIAAPWELPPFLLPPAHDKLLAHDPIRDLWENMHRGGDAYSVITAIGYSFPSYDGYAYEALGRKIINYQRHGVDNTYFGHRRVPIQIITKVAAVSDVHASLPFLKLDTTRIWNEGFSADSLSWLDWGD